MIASNSAGHLYYESISIIQDKKLLFMVDIFDSYTCGNVWTKCFDFATGSSGRCLKLWYHQSKT